MDTPEIEVEMTTIPLERYEELLAAEDFLSCLEAAGVDNWSGYAVAQEMAGD